jgi:hypothetical protein
MMRQFLLTLALCITLGTRLCAQGFSIHSTLGQVASRMVSLRIENDTIITIGTFLDDSIPQGSGLHFTKFDSSGNILSQKLHYTDEPFALIEGSEDLVKLKDGSGYAIIGTHFSSQRGFLLRLDNNGDFLWLKRYPKANTFFTNYWRFLIDTGDGFLISINRQWLDYKNDLFVIKTDYDGNLLWEKIYDNGEVERNRSFLQVNNNLFVVGGLFTNHTFDKFGSSIVAIDSLGNEQWSWVSPDEVSEFGAYGLHRETNGDWVYATSRVIPSPIFENLAFPKIVRRDSNFNLIWETEIARTSLPEEVGFRYLKRHPLGGFMGSGVIWNIDNQGLDGGTCGLTARFTDDGQYIWQRYDTIFPDVQENADRLAALGFLSSGNAVICGSGNSSEPRTHSWLLKITPDGCVDTLFCAPSPTAEPPFSKRASVQVFPNPAQQHLQIELDTGIERLEITNISGHIVEHSRHGGGTQISISVAHLPNGLYAFRVLDTQGVWHFGKFIVQR